MLLKINKKIFIYIFLFLILGSLNNKNLIRIEPPSISIINVTGLAEKENENIIGNLESFKLQNLFTLNKSEIKRILNSNNLIEKYTIFKRYPSTLEIQIIQAKFLAKVVKNGKTFYLGSNGKLINSNTKKIKLPLIFGEFEKKNFFDLLKVINNSNFDFKEINKLFFFNSGRWDIETNSGILIKLPNKDLKHSFDLSLKILKDDKFNEIKIIDVRQVNQVITNG